MTRVLVAYASAHGSTRRIAERIADRLVAAGLQAASLPVTQLDEVHGYDAFVVGSAIHDQAWLPEAIQFIHRHARLLRSSPVWLFSVGVPVALAPALRGWALREGSKVMEPMRTRVDPRGERLFFGAVSPDQLSLLRRAVFRLLGGRFGDFLDVVVIDAWVADIARDLVTRSRSARGGEAAEGASGADRR